MSSYTDVLIHRWQEQGDREKAKLPEKLPVLDDFGMLSKDVVGKAKNLRKTEEGILADIVLTSENDRGYVVSGWEGNFDTDDEVKLVLTGYVINPEQDLQPLSEYNGQY